MFNWNDYGNGVYGFDSGYVRPELAGPGIGFREFGEVRITFEIDAALARFIEQFLPLSDHAEIMIIQDKNFDGELVNTSGG